MMIMMRCSIFFQSSSNQHDKFKHKNGKLSYAALLLELPAPTREVTSYKQTRVETIIQSSHDTTKAYLCNFPIIVQNRTVFTEKGIYINNSKLKKFEKTFCSIMESIEKFTKTSCLENYTFYLEPVYELFIQCNVGELNSFKEPFFGQMIKRC